jgi:riboflavin kinase/FMN adenylyltransferase
MLGRPYAISGRVIEGNHLGQQLGFPTANLDTTGLALPPNGVYAGFADAKGKTYRVALNIGFRPTITSTVPRVSIEAHLLDFNGELYGEELEIEIGQKLREEVKFASQAELREQIARDIIIVRTQP